MHYITSPFISCPSLLEAHPYRPRGWRRRVRLVMLLLVPIVPVGDWEALRRGRHVALLRILLLTGVPVGRVWRRSAGVAAVPLVAWLGLVDGHTWGRRRYGGGRGWVLLGWLSSEGSGVLPWSQRRS